MGPNDNAVLINAYSACQELLAEQGYHVGVLSDFREVNQLLRSGGKTVTPFFQNRFFDFNGHNGFCHVAMLDGAPVSFYCSQVFDTGSMNYLQYHRTQLMRIYGEEHDIDEAWVCRPMTEIKGKVIYSGDALNVEEARNTKNSLKRLQVLAKMNLYLGLLTWPDVSASVGLARGRHVALGLGFRYAAYHSYPYATRWITPPSDRKQDDAFLFSKRDDILYQAQIDACGFDLALEA